MTDKDKHFFVFDFETTDPYIERGLGGGWVYGIKVPESDFRVLGCAWALYVGGELVKSGYTPAEDTLGMGEVRFLFETACYVIAHNAQYDLGCARYLGWTIDYVKVIDTEVLSRLYNSTLLSHSLDNLLNHYGLGGKNDAALIQSVKDNDLLPWLQCEMKRRQKNKIVFYEKPEKRDWSRHKDKDILKWCKKNMKAIQEADLEAMSKYALADVTETWKLYSHLRTQMGEEYYNEVGLRYSGYSKLCIKMRLRGVRVDLQRVREVIDEIDPELRKIRDLLYASAGREFNPESSYDTGELLVSRGLDVPQIPKKVKGVPTGEMTWSVTQDWLERQNDDVCRGVLEYRKITKFRNTFLKKILDIQEFTVGKDVFEGDYGRIHPTLNLLRARTGRFSSEGPNIQNIPKRDSKLGPLCRSIFVPEENETWVSLDYSNQEGRLQIHYASRLQCPGVAPVVEQFKEDPEFDLHQHVADLMGVSRFAGKTINLGISYGMGVDKLAASLGCDPSEAKRLRSQYYENAPYLKSKNDWDPQVPKHMKSLDFRCKDTIAARGYLITLGGRHVHNENGYEYKALNKLIQGSAFDQTMKAMEMADEAGIPVLFPVHDELCASVKKDVDIEKLRDIMVTAYELHIPTVVNVSVGDNWGQC